MLTKQAVISDLKKIVAASRNTLEIMKPEAIKQEYSSLTDILSWTDSTLNNDEMKQVVISINKQYDIDKIENELSNIFKHIDNTLADLRTPKEASLKKEADEEELLWNDRWSFDDVVDKVIEYAESNGTSLEDAFGSPDLAEPIDFFGDKEILDAAKGARPDLSEGKIKANPKYEIKTGTNDELKQIEASLRKNHPSLTDIEIGQKMRDLISEAKTKTTDKQILARLTTAEISNMFPEFDKTGGVWQVEEKNGKKTIIRPNIKEIEDAIVNKGHIRKVNDIVLYDQGGDNGKIFEVQIKEVLDTNKYKVTAFQSGKEYIVTESQLLDEDKINDLM